MHRSNHDKNLLHPHTHFHKGQIFCPWCCQIPAQLTEIYKDLLTEGPPTRETTYGKGKPQALTPSSQLQFLPESLSLLELTTKISLPTAPNSAESENSTSVFYHD